MFTVLLVEDEPAALRYLSSLIRRNFPDFGSIETAADGEQALERVAACPPDLVVTDVRMPNMDGIALVARLKVIAPETPALIVSGYDDFDYVRKALNTGVVDYVLKPVTARRLAEVFERLLPTLQRNADSRTLAEVRALIDNRGAAHSESALIAKFHLAILRRGGPLSRFTNEPGDPIDEVHDAGFCSFAGRDRQETTIVAFASRVPREQFVRRCDEEMALATGTYKTLLYAPLEVPGSRIGKEIAALSVALDRSIVLGMTRTVDGGALPEVRCEIDSMVAGRIEHEVINGNRIALDKIIAEMVDSWERGRTPVLAVQSLARGLLDVVREASLNRIDQTEIELSLEELVANANRFSDVEKSLCALAGRIAGHDSAGRRRESARVLVGNIQMHVDSFFARKLTVESVAERFHISPSYLSRLFRAETGHSFNEYLREYRVEKAKNMMRESPDMPLKNVAGYVGFADPFYFSRVFRSVTGEAPSEFLRRERKTPDRP